MITSFVDAVNGQDVERVLTAFSTDSVIVEDLPPYCWTGPSAPSDWLAAMGQNAATLGLTSVLMEIGEPIRTDVNGDRAYVVRPGLLRLASSDQEMRASGTLTFTLKRAPDGWLIQTLVWSGAQPQ